LLNASQALYFRTPKSSELITTFLSSYRSEVPFVAEDMVFYKPMVNTVQFINNFNIDNDLLFD
jgi:histidine ammonia-lyase